MNEFTKMQTQKAMMPTTVLPNKSILQRTAVNSTPVHQVPPIVHDVLRSSGQPLDAATRAFMEPRFRHDFSQVRVHTDARAADSAQAVNARAYTVGQNTVFAASQYAPGTSAGKQLLAHELAHVVQQKGASTVQSLEIDNPHNSAEHEAVDTANQVMMGMQPLVRTYPAQAGIQRQPANTPTAAKDEEVKITPTPKTIPISEISPTGLPDKASAATSAGKSTSDQEVEKPEASIQASLKDREVTTNLEIAIPVKPLAKGYILGQPFAIGKGLNLELSMGPNKDAPTPVPVDVAASIAIKAFTLDLKSFRKPIPGLTEFGPSVKAEANFDPATLKPDFSAKAGVGAEYQIGKTPIFLQGSIGYKVKVPLGGPAKAEPTADVGLIIKFP
jgi:hypothetical protein